MKQEMNKKDLKLLNSKLHKLDKHLTADFIDGQDTILITYPTYTEKGKADILVLSYQHELKSWTANPTFGATYPLSSLSVLSNALKGVEDWYEEEK